MTMLDIKNVRKTFNKNTINEKKALCGIDLHLNEGDFVTVIGGNGAGKSTMLNMIAVYIPLTPGKLKLTESIYQEILNINGQNISEECSRTR